MRRILVKCQICGREFISTTVTKRYYRKGECIDYGCPYCGPQVPLLATQDRRRKK